MGAWTGKELIVAGGMSRSPSGPVPRIYRDGADGTAAVAAARPGSPAAVWTGTEMIVCGGSIPGDPQPTIFTDGTAYTPPS